MKPILQILDRPFPSGMAMTGDTVLMFGRSKGTRRRGAAPRRIGVVGCVKEKARRPSPAKDLYTSPLFRGRRRYVEKSCDEWWVLSAAHGLVHPEEVLAPYDVTLKDQGRPARRAWSASVLVAIEDRIRPRAGDVFEVHAGADYRDFGLVDGLRAMGCVVENPTEGMPIGEQLRFYSQARRR
jgi:hypothetical protein